LEIRQKFNDKEGSELRYIRTHLTVFDKYEKQKDDTDPIHERSRPVIEAWRFNRTLRGHVSVPMQDLHGELHTFRNPQHRGKSKVFSFECISSSIGDDNVSTPEASAIHHHSSPYEYTTGSSSSSSSSSSSRSAQMCSLKRALSRFSPENSTSTKLGIGIAAMENEVYERVDDLELGEYSLPPSAAKRAKFQQGSRKKSVDGKYKQMFQCSDDENTQSEVEDVEEENNFQSFQDFE
jgi:hypothetical protein